jgi:uncharacterized protein YggT (Ycf19 family)
MIILVLLTFVDLFVFIFNALLIVRIFASYFASPTGRFYSGLFNLTEPLLVPVRRWLPQTAGVDFAPLATFFLLQLVDWGLHALFGA